MTTHIIVNLFKEYTVLILKDKVEFITGRAKFPEGNKLTVCPEGSKYIFLKETHNNIFSRVFSKGFPQ